MGQQLMCRRARHGSSLPAREVGTVAWDTVRDVAAPVRMATTPSQARTKAGGARGETASLQW